MTGTELGGARAEATRIERSLHQGIHDLIKQRRAETSLQAADIAISLGISKRTLHRTLTGMGETFGELLVRERVALASRMLQSPAFNRLNTAEFGRRAGFVDASHFTKVIRVRTGQTTLQMRKGRH